MFAFLQGSYHGDSRLSKLKAVSVFVGIFKKKSVVFNVWQYFNNLLARGLYNMRCTYME